MRRASTSKSGRARNSGLMIVTDWRGRDPACQAGF
jgi:hypothetical protein